MARFGLGQLLDFGGSGRRVGGGANRFVPPAPPAVRDIGPPPAYRDMNGVGFRQVLDDIDNGDFRRMSPRNARNMERMNKPGGRRPRYLEEEGGDVIGR